MKASKIQNVFYSSVLLFLSFPGQVVAIVMEKERYEAFQSFSAKAVALMGRCLLFFVILWLSSHLFLILISLSNKAVVAHKYPVKTWPLWFKMAKKLISITQILLAIATIAFGIYVTWSWTWLDIVLHFIFALILFIFLILLERALGWILVKTHFQNKVHTN